MGMPPHQTTGEPGGAASVWGRHRVPDDTETRLKVGPLGLRLSRRVGELWVAAERQPPGPADEWMRWAAPPDFEVGGSPILPDRPVVVAPEVPFDLPPGARARIYVRIPLWARITFADGPDVTLSELPSIVMSDTWWGDFGHGELGFWLPTRARRRVDAEAFEPHLVVCPLELAVRVMHMTVFEASGRLWSNEMKVLYERDLEGSRIDVEDGPPGEAGEANALTDPREKPERGLRALTFGRLKQAAGL
jgi:hypothetical protein